MNAINWMRYCHEKTYLLPAEVINALSWLDTGSDWLCRETGECDPWRCDAFADGYGMYCGEDEAEKIGITYYIPDPYIDDTEKDVELGKCAWDEMLKKMPKQPDLQLELW